MVNIRATCRYLTIIPRSPPPAPPFVPPSTRQELLDQFRLAQNDPKRVSLLMTSLKSLLPSLFPNDFLLVSKFLSSQSQTDPLLRRVVLNRISELPVDLPTILKLSRLITDRESQRQLSTLIEQKEFTLSKLKQLELIQLMFLCPNMLERILSHIIPKKLTFYEMGTLMNFSAKKIKKNHKVFSRIAHEIIHRQEAGTTPRDVALLMNAYTVLGSGGEAIFENLEKKCIENHAKFGSVEIPIVLHAAAKNESDLLFPVFADWLCRNIDSVSEKGIGMIAYAYGQVGTRNETLFNVISQYMQRNIDRFSIRSIAMVVFGFSKLGIRDSELFTLIERELVWRQNRKKKYTLADIAMISKGYSLITFNQPLVLMSMIKALKEEVTDSKSVLKLVEGFSNDSNNSFEAWISKSVPPILHELDGREINTLLTSFLKLRINNRPLLNSVCQSVDIAKFNFKLIPQFVKLLGNLDMYDSAIIAKCSKLVSVHLGSFDCGELLDFLHGLSQFNQRDEKTLAKVMQAIEFQSDHVLNPNQLVVLLNSVTRLRVGSRRLHDQMLKQIFENLPLFTSERVICNSLFALATGISSGDIDSEWTQPIIEGLIDQLETLDNITLEGIRQVQIFLLFSENERDILKKIAQVNTFEATSPSIEQSSATHREISRYLSLLGQEHRNEVVWGPFSLDIMLKNNLVVEIDGPHHFFRDSALRTSSSMLKHKLMLANGFHVKHIPYQEWLQCTNESKKLQYISAIVEELASFS